MVNNAIGSTENAICSWKSTFANFEEQEREREHLAK